MTTARFRAGLAGLAAAALAVTGAGPALAAPGGRTLPVSIGQGGALGMGIAYGQAISGDGNLVAFESDAANLSLLDLNGVFDVFVRDVAAGRTERISVGPAGLDTDRSSYHAALTPDGRYVAFASEATNLLSWDTNAQPDVFLWDREKKAMERVSMPDGVSGVPGLLPPEAQGDGTSQLPSLSADGRFVAFDSFAANLVPGDSNDEADVFVRDRQTGTTERISLDAGGKQAALDSGAPVISADGRYVAFESYAPLVAGDDNNEYDIYLYDRAEERLERVSVDNAGTGADGASFAPTISADGRYVAYDSLATNLVRGDTNKAYDVFVRDRVEQRTTRVSVDAGGAQVRGDSGLAALSADGRQVGFHSFAADLVPGDTNGGRDVFVHELRTGAVERVSVTTDGEQVSGTSGAPALSADGSRVAFDSLAGDVVPGDTPESDDVYLRERAGG